MSENAGNHVAPQGDIASTDAPSGLSRNGLAGTDDLRTPVDQVRIAAATTEILQAIGEDLQREGLLDTPARVGRAWVELTSGYHVDPVRLVNDAIFEVEHDDMVIVRDIEFHSLCEHHLLPFVGRAHVAYIPQGKIVGLSKIPRIVDMFARRLQVQENLTRQVADFLNSLLTPQGVAVVMEGVHLCATMRGVKKHEASMTTSCMLGAFRDNPALRGEFQVLLGRSGTGQIIR